MHPRTKKLLAESNQRIPVNVVTTSPFSYVEMLMALKRCEKVITDSGGLQKEAYWMRKPCVTLRTETEWTETLVNNWNILTGPDEQKIIKAVRTCVDDETWTKLYGDGNAAKLIAMKIKELYVFNSKS
jgi:UDP-GlcNAc3NAcA epimerase